MPTRRFVYDEAAGAVVEVAPVRGGGLSARERYADVKGQYEQDFTTKPSDQSGTRLREAALERAERREWSHKKFGTESRWGE